MILQQSLFVIPTKAKPRGGIFALTTCTAANRCVDPSTSFHSARDDILFWFCVYFSRAVEDANVTKLAVLFQM